MRRISGLIGMAAGLSVFSLGYAGDIAFISGGTIGEGDSSRAFGRTALWVRAGLAAHIESCYIIITSFEERAKK